GNGMFYEDLKNILSSESSTSVIESLIKAVNRYDREDCKVVIRNYLYYPDNRVRTAAVASMWHRIETKHRYKVFIIVNRILETGTDEEILSLINSLGDIGDPAVLRPVEKVLSRIKVRESRASGIVKACISSLGKIPSGRCIDLLLGLLPKIEKRFYPSVRKALIVLFPRVKQSEIVIRLNVAMGYPRLLLLEAMCRSGREWPEEITRSLYGGAEKTLQEIYTDIEYLSFLSGYKDGRSGDLLYQAVLENGYEIKKSMILYIVSLLDKSGELRSIIPKIRHSDQHIRANAVEMLENICHARFRKTVVPLFDDGKPERLVSLGRSVWKVKQKNLYSTLYDLYNSYDSWIRACACSFYLSMPDPAGGRKIANIFSSGGHSGKEIVRHILEEALSEA
ncbi:MAG: hypothetical protein ACLFQK_04950, partial [Fibrobacterota bacterium]